MKMKISPEWRKKNATRSPLRRRAAFALLGVPTTKRGKRTLAIRYIKKPVSSYSKRESGFRNRS